MKPEALIGTIDGSVALIRWIVGEGQTKIAQEGLSKRTCI